MFFVVVLKVDLCFVFSERGKRNCLRVLQTPEHFYALMTLLFDIPCRFYSYFQTSTNYSGFVERGLNKKS